jgi:hypothetical protein
MNNACSRNARLWELNNVHYRADSDVFRSPYGPLLSAILPSRTSLTSVYATSICWMNASLIARANTYINMQEKWSEGEKGPERRREGCGHQRGLFTRVFLWGRTQRSPVPAVLSGLVRRLSWCDIQRAEKTYTHRSLWLSCHSIIWLWNWSDWHHLLREYHTAACPFSWKALPVVNLC